MEEICFKDFGGKWFKDFGGKLFQRFQRKIVSKILKLNCLKDFGEN